MKITGTELTIGTLWLSFVGFPLAIGALALGCCMVATVGLFSVACKLFSLGGRHGV